MLLKGKVKYHMNTSRTYSVLFSAMFNVLSFLSYLTMFKLYWFLYNAQSLKFYFLKKLLDDFDHVQLFSHVLC